MDSIIVEQSKGHIHEKTITMMGNVEWLMNQARLVSNIGKPETDNNYGRAATELKHLRAMNTSWISVDDEMPAPHARYRAWRKDIGHFDATPCYGLHSPWWVPRNSVTKEESEPISMKDSYWKPLEDPPEEKT